MDRRSKLSDVAETGVPKIVERSPLLDPRKLRSSRSTPASSSLCRSVYSDTINSQRPPSKTRAASFSLKTISELGQPNGAPNALNRSHSAPHRPRSSPHLTPSPNHIRSPQYRVNPIVKFDNRPFPEQMNYGIAGYNTARSRSFTSVSDISTTRPPSFPSIPESARRPRSFSTALPETKTRPTSFTSIPESTVGLPTRATKSVLWRSWTRRFRDKMGQVRVSDTCSKLLSRFRGG